MNKEVFDKRNSEPRFCSSVMLYLAVVVLYLLATAVTAFSPLGVPLVLVSMAFIVATFFYASVVEKDKGVVFLVFFNIAVMASYFPLYGLALSLKSDELFVNVLEIKILAGLRPSIILPLLLLLALCFVRENIKNKLYYLLFLLYFAVNFMLSSAGIMAKTAYTINTFMIFFTVLYVVGLDFGIKRKTRDGLLGLFSVALIFMVIYSLGITNVFYDVFRPDLISAFRNRSLEPLAYGDVPGPWMSRIADFEFMRMAATFPDPIVAGYFFAVVSLVCIQSKKHCMFLFFFVAMLMTVSKGAWIFFAMVILLSLVYKLTRSNRLIMFLYVFVVSLQLYMAKILDTSAYIHYKGLEGAIMSVWSSWKTFFFGYGVGKGGNLESQVSNETFSRDTWLSTGAESGVGVLIYQLGTVGLLFSLIFIFKFYKKNNSSDNSADKFRLYLWMSLLANSFLQENIVNSSVILIGLLGDTMLRVSNNNNQRTHVAYV